MKRTLWIVAAVVIVLLIVAVWVYLMLFGSPKTGGEVFANFGFGSTERTDVPVTQPPLSNPETTTTVDVSSDRLSQLTTRAVAGFVGTTTRGVPHVRYAEVGTGHVYDINLVSGEETLISRTTIPRVQNAYFAPNATVLALESYNGYQQSSFFGFISTTTETIEGIDLPPNINNLTVTLQNRARFIRPQDDISIGYESRLDGSLSELFRIPFQSVTALWGSDATRIYNRPDKSLLGYLYDINGASMDATELSGYGFVADDWGNYLGYSVYQGDSYQSGIFDKTTDTVRQSPIVLLPEKCAAQSEATWCAAPVTKSIDVTDWYKGQVSSDDYLWVIDPITAVATLAVDLKATAGRPLDISELAGHPDGSSVLFTNKTDGTLWRFTTN